MKYTRLHRPAVFKKRDVLTERVEEQPQRGELQEHVEPCAAEGRPQPPWMLSAKGTGHRSRFAMSGRSTTAERRRPAHNSSQRDAGWYPGGLTGPPCCEGRHAKGSGRDHARHPNQTIHGDGSGIRGRWPTEPNRARQADDVAANACRQEIRGEQAGERKATLRPARTNRNTCAAQQHHQRATTAKRERSAKTMVKTRTQGGYALQGVGDRVPALLANEENEQKKPQHRSQNAHGRPAAAGRESDTHSDVPGRLTPGGPCRSAWPAICGRCAPAARRSAQQDGLDAQDEQHHRELQKRRSDQVLKQDAANSQRDQQHHAGEIHQDPHPAKQVDRLVGVAASGT